MYHTHRPMNIMETSMDTIMNDHFDPGPNSDEDLEIDADNPISRFPNTPPDFWQLVHVLGYMQFAHQVCNMNEVFVFQRTKGQNLTSPEKKALKRAKKANVREFSSTVLKPNTSGHKISKNAINPPLKISSESRERRYTITRRSVDNAWFFRIQDAFQQWASPKGWTLEREELTMTDALLQMQSEAAKEFWQTRARLAGNPNLAEIRDLCCLLSRGFQGESNDSGDLSVEERTNLAEDNLFGGDGDDSIDFSVAEQQSCDEQIRMLEEHSMNIDGGIRHDGDGDIDMS